MRYRTLLRLRSLGWLLLLVGGIRFFFALGGTSGWVLVVSLLLIVAGSILAGLRYVVRGRAG